MLPAGEFPAKREAHKRSADWYYQHFPNGGYLNSKQGECVRLGGCQPGPGHVYGRHTVMSAHRLGVTGCPGHGAWSKHSPVSPAFWYGMLLQTGFGQQHASGTNCAHQALCCCACCCMLLPLPPLPQVMVAPWSAHQSTSRWLVCLVVVRPSTARSDEPTPHPDPRAPRSLWRLEPCAAPSQLVGSAPFLTLP